MIESLLFALLISVPEATLAESFQFLVCQPGGPELEEQEQTVIRDFYRYVGKKVGLKEEAITGHYFNHRAACVKALEQSPEVVILSLDLFLEHKTALSLKPVAQLAFDGATTSKFYVMTSQSGPATLQELRGKPITGTLVDNPEFVARVLLDGRLGAPGELVLVPEKLGLRAVRNVIRGKAAAVLLDEPQKKALVGTPLMKGLRVVYESKPLPNAPVAVVPSRVPSGLAERIEAVLLAMNSDPRGQELVKTFGLKAFVKTAANTWDDLEAAMKAHR